MSKHSEITEPSNSTKPVLQAVFFDFYYWNKCNPLWNVSQHHSFENLILIEYVGTSKIRICVCVEKENFELGLDKFWIEFKRQSENNSMRN